VAVVRKVLVSDALTLADAAEHVEVDAGPDRDEQHGDTHQQCDEQALSAALGGRRAAPRGHTRASAHGIAGGRRPVAAWRSAVATTTRRSAVATRRAAVATTTRRAAVATTTRRAAV